MEKFTFDSPIGILLLEADDKGLRSIRFEAENNYAQLPQNHILKEARTQLQQYFQSERKQFDLPLNLLGSPFQLLVWQALRTVPYGKLASYGDIARLIGNPKASRAVGGANNRNPIPIIVPCHRIIGQNGTLTGYAGGLERKQFLLDLENKNV